MRGLFEVPSDPVYVCDADHCECISLDLLLRVDIAGLFGLDVARQNLDRVCISKETLLLPTQGKVLFYSL